MLTPYIRLQHLCGVWCVICKCLTIITTWYVCMCGVPSVQALRQHLSHGVCLHIMKPFFFCFFLRVTSRKTVCRGVITPAICCITALPCVGGNFRVAGVRQHRDTRHCRIRFFYPRTVVFFWRRCLIFLYQYNSYMSMCWSQGPSIGCTRTQGIIAWCITKMRSLLRCNLFVFFFLFLRHRFQEREATPPHC